MSGILDNKSRIIDAILTIEGRRQMAEGTFEVSYVTFTDSGVCYLPDESGHEDPTKKIYFEATNLPQDQITFEANDEGKLVPFRAQDVKLFTPTSSNIPSSFAEGRISNGRLTLYQYVYGRRIKTSGISRNDSDLGKGFVYSDENGLTGSILVDPNLNSSAIIASASPYKAFIGTHEGMGPQQFALAISGAIGQLKTLGGPDVNCYASNDSVYVDTGDSTKTSVVSYVGELSSPIILQQDSFGGNLILDEVENASFSTQIKGILTSSFDNFQELQSISSINRLMEDDQFFLSSNEVDIDMTQISDSVLKTFDKSVSVNTIDSLFSDDKLSHLENFMYLPPIVKTSDTLVPDKTKIDKLKPYLLGNYPSWGNNESRLTFQKLNDQLIPFRETKQTIDFKQSSLKNRIIGQIFEVSDSEVSKLDVIDFGPIMNDAQETTAVTNNVFFAGKTYLDNRGTTCYANIFTLIFSKRRSSTTVK